MGTLERAIEIAAAAHEEQVDKAGEPYILHPLRVMLSMDDRDARIVATLHDVVEDSDWTLEALEKEGFSEEVVDAVDALTRRTEESYEEFAQRAAAHPVARRVKIADIEDNLDLSRIPEPTQKDRQRIQRYRAALKILRS